MWFIFALIFVLIIGGIFMDLLYRLEKAPKPKSRHAQIIYWCLIALFYIAIIYWIRTW
jgi:apolipoprotein N-acyltransferase